MFSGFTGIYRRRFIMWEIGWKIDKYFDFHFLCVCYVKIFHFVP